jgi:serine/threonine protein phosphatase PrpC
MDKVFKAARPMTELKKYTDKFDTVSNSGSTASIVKIYTKGGITKLYSAYVGNSRIVVYDGDKILYKPVGHTLDIKAEGHRLIHRVYTGELKHDYKDKYIALAPTKIAVGKASSIKFPNIELNMTQSLGYCNSTGYAPSIYHLDITGKKITVIIATDGLWDMLTMGEILTLHQKNSYELLELAETRWGQEWDVIGGAAVGKLRLPKKDDIAIAMMWN